MSRTIYLKRGVFELLKKRYLLLILIVFLLAISTASAQEINNLTFSNDSDLTTQSLNENNILADTGSFDELQYLINHNDIVNLTKDYIASKNSSRVIINSDKIINGNNHVLNGNKITDIFLINGGNIVFNDIQFINGKNWEGEGGAIYVINAYNLTFNNVVFKDNFAYSDGGAIYSDAGCCHEFINCTFVNNCAYRLRGGAIYINKGNIQVINSTFKDNKCNGDIIGDGGAIYINSSENSEKSSLILNSIFTDNFADDNGGAICSYAILEIKNSTFKSNKADDDNGGAIHALASLNITDSSFIDNFADESGGAIYVSPDDLHGIKRLYIRNCTFKSNKADDNSGGAIP